MSSLKTKKFIILLIVIANFLLLAVPAMANDNKNIDINLDVNTNKSDAVTIGGNTKASETVNGDAVAILGNCRVEKGATGDVVAILGNSEAVGAVNGDVVAIGGNVTIDGTVNGDVVAIGGKAILKGNSVVNGDVVASSIEKGDAAIVRGSIQTNIPLFKVPINIGGFSLFGYNPLTMGLRFLGIFFNFLIITLFITLYPQGVEEIARSAEKDTWRDLLIGLIAFVLSVPIFITIIGIPVVAFLIIAARLLGYSGVLLLVGRKFSKAVNWHGVSIYIEALMGAILIGLAQMIPFLGSVVGIVVFWIALGATLDTKFGTGRPWFNRIK